MSDQHSKPRSTTTTNLKTPNLVTIHDLTQEEREHIETYRKGQALHWRWKPGYTPKNVGYARPLR